jgi:hypothetical protein
MYSPANHTTWPKTTFSRRSGVDEVRRPSVRIHPIQIIQGDTNPWVIDLQPLSKVVYTGLTPGSGKNPSHYFPSPKKPGCRIQVCFRGLHSRANNLANEGGVLGEDLLACNEYLPSETAVTIVAASSSAANQGFLADRKPPRPSVKIPCWGKDGELGAVSLRPEGWYDAESEPVNSRAWTLEERLLSPRLLIYATHTLQYQCHYHPVTLGCSIHIPAGLGSWRLPDFLFRDMIGPKPDFHELINAWRSPDASLPTLKTSSMPLAGSRKLSIRRSDNHISRVFGEEISSQDF